MTTTRRRRGVGVLSAFGALLAFSGGIAAPPPAAAAPVVSTVTTSGTAPGVTPTALVDGDIEGGSTGAEWRADGSTAPWVQLTFSGSTTVASAQVAGPAAAGKSVGAQLHGMLEFSDGSAVPVAGIDAGAVAPTTVAFAPRATRWVKLRLSRTVPTATMALREFSVYDGTTTPPRWPTTGKAYQVAPSEASCSAAAPVPAPRANRLSLVCPKTGSAVSGDVTVVLSATPRRRLVAFAVLPNRSVDTAQRIAVATTDNSGRAVLRFSARSLPDGPVGIKVTAVGAGASATTPLYVQLVNTNGTETQDSVRRSNVPDGMTLRWDEDFDDPLSVSASGAGAEYAAAKPEKRGASQYGDAVFADPSAGAGTLATLPDGYLRVRVEPIAGRRVNDGWGQKHLTGFLSSSRVGGSGFSAQYAYFEARMLGAPGTGTWPAFWMLDSESATPRQSGVGEVDAVELYGHATRGSCHTIHDWGRDTGKEKRQKCPDPNGFEDWAMAWHNYGARVTPNETIFFIDGVEVHRLPKMSRQGLPYFFMVNLALGGGYTPDLSRTGGVSDLYVDWVRVYT